MTDGEASANQPYATTEVELEELDFDLTDLLHESLVFVTIDGRVSRWNKASESIYGFSRSQAQGRQFDDLVGGMIWQDAVKGLSVKCSCSAIKDLRRTRSDGSAVIVRTQLSLRRTEAGDPLYFIETAVDITADFEREAAAEAEKKHYRNVFQAIPISVWDIDFSAARSLALTWLRAAQVEPHTWFEQNPERVRDLMRVTYARDVNEHALMLFGPCEREDLLVSVERFWPDTSTSDFADWLVSSLAGQTYFTREVRQRKFGGNEFDAIFTASYAPGSVNQGRVVVSISDYSETKRGQAAVLESEAFYADMFHGSAFSAWHLDASEAQKIYKALHEDGINDFFKYADENEDFIDRVAAAIKVVDVNEYTLSLFEIDDRSEVVGKSISPFWFHDERRAALLGSLEASFNLLPTYQGAARMRTLKGNEIAVLFTRSASSALSSGGHLLLAIVDMTEKVAAQNALAEMQANFAHADRVSSLGQLTASIAHEVNQPLTAITANGETSLKWLSHIPPDLGRVHALLDDMIVDARRASDIVAHIRSMALPQAGQRDRLSLNRIVDEAIVLLTSQLIKCGTRATCELQPNLPLIECNAIQLQQVVVNLVLNALQAMAGKEGSRVRLKTTSTLETIALTVEDNGPGIQRPDLSRVFNSFFTTKPDGMGMGLAICRTLVEAHGGAISAAGSALGGACFTVSLPTS